MEDKQESVEEIVQKLFIQLDREGYDGWMCIRKNSENSRFKDWSFVAAKSPENLFPLVFRLVEILYVKED